MEDMMKRVSKKLSYVLRHAPESIGLTLGPGGWVRVDALVEGMVMSGFEIDASLLAQVVATNSKQRFSISQDGQLIRANQGHSVAVDLQLSPSTPPELLFHGTARRSWDSIWEKGLLSMSRHHVHLSTDARTASQVGRRHGKLLLLVVRAEAMQTDGHVFFVSDNGVWLTERVPPEYLTISEESVHPDRGHARD